MRKNIPQGKTKNIFQQRGERRIIGKQDQHRYSRDDGKNYSQKQIIEAILQAYNIKNTSLNYEAVKKSDYRNQKKIRRLVFDDLQSIVN